MGEETRGSSASSPFARLFCKEARFLRNSGEWDWKSGKMPCILRKCPDFGHISPAGGTMPDFEGKNGGTGE